jgi:hypothetical protein
MKIPDFQCSRIKNVSLQLPLLATPLQGFPISEKNLTFAPQ